MGFGITIRLLGVLLSLFTLSISYAESISPESVLAATKPNMTAPEISRLCDRLYKIWLDSFRNITEKMNECSARMVKSSPAIPNGTITGLCSFKATQHLNDDNYPFYPELMEYYEKRSAYDYKHPSISKEEFKKAQWQFVEELDDSVLKKIHEKYRVPLSIRGYNYWTTKANTESAQQYKRNSLLEIGTQLLNQQRPQSVQPKTGQVIYNQGGNCPIGFHPWVDKWGNSICKEL